MSTAIIISALALSAGFYLFLGARQARRVHLISDLIPLQRHGEASVETGGEFSASTVATTVSLATVLLAFFELAPYLGSWLLWTVATTAMGLVVVRLAFGRISQRLRPYGEHIPTIHEFLGTEYAAPSLAGIGAMFTSLGFLGAFAVELTVGSRLFAALIPGIPTWLVVALLALVVVLYTSAGGFRTVVVTDWWQMIGIWALLAALLVYYSATASTQSGLLAAWHRLPRTTWDFSWREGLWAFLIGIFVINVPTFLSDMSMWQRVTSARVPGVAFAGLARSALSAAVVWGLFAVLACLTPMVVDLTDNVNPMLRVLQQMVATESVWSSAVLFVTIVGLYAAMLSTGSTQLIALSHAVHEDLLCRSHRDGEIRGVWTARAVLLVGAILAMLVVETLSAIGFSIADLVFAIYGAQLGLFAPVLLALVLPRDCLRGLGRYGLVAVSLGFVSGWGSAIAGKVYAQPNLVFLAPAISMAASMLVMIGGLARMRIWKRPT